MADYSAAPSIDRTDLRRAYRQEEEVCIAERLDQAAPAARVHAAAAGLAIDLIEGARGKKASGIDAFLQQYGLDTEEGIALMCLAEALLRVPDDETADLLIEDMDIFDLQEGIRETSNPQLISVYSNLKCGSENHLRSFFSQAQNLGAEYSPDYISMEEYNQIINSPRSSCQANN